MYLEASLSIEHPLRTPPPDKPMSRLNKKQVKCVFRELACSIGTDSQAAADTVYAAALKILGWSEHLGYRLKGKTAAQVALADPVIIAAMLAAQNSAAGKTASSRI
jgi:hypothetical protein